MPQDPKPRALKKIKTGLVARGLSLAKITAGAGASLAAQKVAGLLRTPAEKQEAWQDYLKSQASHFSDEVGELKGSLMKAGQMLSVYGEYFFPPEVNQIFKRLQNETPPVEWARIQEILSSQKNGEVFQELEIEPTALAGASLGQVHRARIKSTGETLVLKIQYPGVERAIESDLKALKSFITFMKVLPAEGPLDALMLEMKEMLLQETDYRREVELMEEYRRKLAQDSRFVIPQVHTRYCSDKVIAMSYERGLKADDPLIQSLSQERRNRLASNFLDLYFREIFEWHLVQTDPHLGNYRLRMDPAGHDRIVLFDFGATRKFSEAFFQTYGAMIRGALTQSEEFEKASLQLGFIRDQDDPKLLEIFRSFCQQTVEPFQPGPYDWKKSDLPKRLTDLGVRILKEFPLRPPPREIVFLDRKTAGVFIFLSVLGAHFEARPLLMKYLDQLPALPVSRAHDASKP